MPRYFFHVHDGRDIPDEEGIELASPDEARNQAVDCIWRDAEGLGWRFLESNEWVLTVKTRRVPLFANSRSPVAANHAKSPAKNAPQTVLGFFLGLRRSSMPSCRFGCREGHPVQRCHSLLSAISCVGSGRSQPSNSLRFSYIAHIK